MSDESFIEIEFPQSPIPAGCLRQLVEVTIKGDGCIWRIHKYDVDPFPSKPHAHNVESGLKLDLSTGYLYLGRQHVHNISKKDLKFIRTWAELNNISLPPIAV